MHNPADMVTNRRTALLRERPRSRVEFDQGFERGRKLRTRETYRCPSVAHIMLCPPIDDLAVYVSLQHFYGEYCRAARSPVHAAVDVRRISADVPHGRQKRRVADQPIKRRLAANHRTQLRLALYFRPIEKRRFFDSSDGRTQFASGSSSTRHRDAQDARRQ